MRSVWRATDRGRTRGAGGRGAGAFWEEKGRGWPPHGARLGHPSLSSMPVIARELRGGPCAPAEGRRLHPAPIAPLASHLAAAPPSGAGGGRQFSAPPAMGAGEGERRAARGTSAAGRATRALPGAVAGRPPHPPFFPSLKHTTSNAVTVGREARDETGTGGGGRVARRARRRGGARPDGPAARGRGGGVTRVGGVARIGGRRNTARAGQRGAARVRARRARGPRRAGRAPRTATRANAALDRPVCAHGSGEAGGGEACGRRGGGAVDAPRAALGRQSGGGTTGPIAGGARGCAGAGQAAWPQCLPRRAAGDVQRFRWGRRRQPESRASRGGRGASLRRPYAVIASPDRGPGARARAGAE